MVHIKIQILKKKQKQKKQSLRQDDKMVAASTTQGLWYLELLMLVKRAPDQDLKLNITLHHQPMFSSNSVIHTTVPTAFSPTRKNVFSLHVPFWTYPANLWQYTSTAFLCDWESLNFEG